MFRKLTYYLSRFFRGQALLTVIGLVLLAFVTVPIVENVVKNYRANEEIKKLQNDVKTLEAKNFKFDELAREMQSDKYVEEQARLNMDLKKPGEQVAVVLNDVTTTSSINPSNNDLYNVPDTKKALTADEVKTNWERWVEYFGK